MGRRFVLLMSAAAIIVYGSTATAGATVARTASATTRYHYCTSAAPPLGSTRVPVATCFATFAQAVRAATHDGLRLPASTRSGSITPDQINALATPGSSVVIGIDYSDSYYSGSSYLWSAAADCGYYGIAVMPSGWNDVVSSVQTYGGCASTLFWNSYYGGSTTSIGRNSGRATLGTFNDETSSQQWCPAAPCG
ncbi:MAG TPA: hypothetical protein VNF47_07770 [Streptosporangiaceae bacterium]|nr:hypothetical protein [Streptosporangiaceae bacterium]